MADSKEIIEGFINEYPVCEYYFLKHDDLVFSEKVRYICEHECNHYNKSWACPPNIPSVEECMKECDEYDNVLLFSTVAEVTDNLNFTECLAARKDHEQVTRELRDEFKKHFNKVLTLSTGCMMCDECGYPDVPCRHPEERLSTIESHGILIMQTAESIGMCYDCGNNMVTYFSLIFYS